MNGVRASVAYRELAIGGDAGYVLHEGSVLRGAGLLLPSHLVAVRKDGAPTDVSPASSAKRAGPTRRRDALPEMMELALSKARVGRPTEVRVAFLTDVVLDVLPRDPAAAEMAAVERGRRVLWYAIHRSSCRCCWLPCCSPRSAGPNASRSFAPTS